MIINLLILNGIFLISFLEAHSLESCLGSFGIAFSNGLELVTMRILDVFWRLRGSFLDDGCLMISMLFCFV